MREDSPDVLEMLIRHELAIKQLYEIFATLFTKRQDFWQSLAKDEQRHADLLGTLRSEPTLDTWLLHDSRLRPQAITSSIKYVESQIVRAEVGNLSVLQALAIARDLENALIEKQFSKLSESVSKEVRAILEDIATETERHRKSVGVAMNTEKQQSS